MAKVTNWDTVVAREAPSTAMPRPQSNMKMGSSTTLSSAATTLHHMASFGAPSSRMTNSPTAVHIWKTSAGVNQSR